MKKKILPIEKNTRLDEQNFIAKANPSLTN